MLALDRPNHAGVNAVRVTEQRGREVRGTALTELHKGDVLQTGKGKENHTLGSPVGKGGTVTFLVPKGSRFRTGTIVRRVRNEQLIRKLDETYVFADRKEQIPPLSSMTRWQRPGQERQMSFCVILREDFTIKRI